MAHTHRHTYAIDGIHIHICVGVCGDREVQKLVFSKVDAGLWVGSIKRLDVGST